MSTLTKTFLTPEQYLEIERQAESKSEYFQGEMFAMAGAKEPHAVLVANLMRDLGRQLRARGLAPRERDRLLCVPNCSAFRGLNS